MTFCPDDYRHQQVVADGDYRLELAIRGWPQEIPLAQAILERTQIVRDAAEAFLDAGARVLVTPTTEANVVVMDRAMREGKVSADDVRAINRRGAELFRVAAAELPHAGVQVMGAMGPVEQLLLLEEIDEETLYHAYAEQARALAEGGVDAILCEGFHELRALVTVVRAARTATSLPVIAGLVFGYGPQGGETSLGATVPQAGTELTEAGVEVFSGDAGDYGEDPVAVLKQIRQCWDGPIWWRSSAGIPQLIDGQLAYPASPSEFAEHWPTWVASGANFIAGGSGVTAAHIAALSAMTQAPQRRSPRPSDDRPTQ